MSATITGLSEATIDVERQPVHYVEKGSGPPVILVHGYAPISTWRVWESNIDALAEGSRVIALDLPGYGESPAPGSGPPADFGAWFAAHAQTLAAFAAALGLEKTRVCGLSAGGGAGLLLTTQSPSLVERLVLVDSAGSEQADRWRSIAVPTLIVWQREDKLLPLQHGEKLAAAIPEARLEIVEGNAAGIEPYDWHWPQALNPYRFNHLVGEFLGS